MFGISCEKAAARWRSASKPPRWGWMLPQVFDEATGCGGNMRGTLDDPRQALPLLSYFRYGSIAPVQPHRDDFRSAPVSGQFRDQPQHLKRVTSALRKGRLVASGLPRKADLNFTSSSAGIGEIAELKPDNRGKSALGHKRRSAAPRRNVRSDQRAKGNPALRPSRARGAGPR